MPRPIVPSSVREEQLNALPNISFIRWLDGYVNSRSKAVMKCDIDGAVWAARVDSLFKSEKRCPKCAGFYRYSSDEREKQLNETPNMAFVQWVDVYRNCHSKVVVRCHAGHEWSASLNSLLNSHSGCPKCSKKYRYSATEREAQLRSLNGMRFMRWDGTYANSFSKAVMVCDNGHVWSSPINHLINNQTGCPSCSQGGFDPNRPGALYALLHENGAHIKIGISNNHVERIAQLRRSTPFMFSVMHLHHSDDGHGVASLEKAFHQNFEKSGFSDFDGATEWLKFDSNIPKLMRILGA